MKFTKNTELFIKEREAVSDIEAGRRADASIRKEGTLRRKRNKKGELYCVHL